MCIYGLNSHFKCNFKNIFEKTRKFFPLEPFFCMTCMKCLLKCPYSKKLVLPPKILGCTPVTFNLNVHSKFHANILVFANLPIYRKFLDDNITLVFWILRIFYFERDIKDCLYIQVYTLQTLVGVILKKIYIILINKYWHYNLCQFYFEEDKVYLYFYLLALLQKLPKDIVPVVSVSAITSILLKLHLLSTIPK